MILFFDTETTGLPLSWKRPASDVQNWPRVVQVAWLIYSEQGEKVSQRMAIIYPNGYEIPEEAAAVHGITTQMAMEKGEYIEDILLEFEAALKTVNEVVAHNMAFDEKVLLAEFYRYNEPTEFLNKKLVCTMKASTNFCALPAPYGRGAYKWPKLSELHEKLFGESFDGAHDALVDIEACARCYWKLKDHHLL
jgi:DNA polymerase III subunit epsilon